MFRRSSPSSFVVFLSVAGCAASLLHAQVPEQNLVELPPQPAPAFLKRTEIGRVVPYHGRSALFLWGTELELAYAPHVHDLSLHVASGISTFTVWPSASVEGPDRILVANSQGLSLLEYDHGAGAPFFAWSTVPDTLDCAGAVGLACADWNGDGVRDVAAIPSTADRVIVLLADAGIYDHTTFYPLEPGVTLRELEPITWDAGPAREIAVLSSWGTEVYDWTGTRHWQRIAPPLAPPLAPDHVMTPFGPEAVPQSLAIVQRGTNLVNRLLSVHDHEGTVPAINLGPLEVMGIDGADCDGDGDHDLALSLENLTVPPAGATRYLRIFFHDDEAPAPFASANFAQLATGECNAPAVLADPALGDLNDDGLADFVVGVEFGSRAVFHTNLGSIASEGWGSWEETPGWVPGSVGGCPPFHVYRARFGAQDYWNTVTTPDLDQVEVELVVSNVWGDLTASGRTHLQVLLWFQETPISLVTPSAQQFHYQLTDEFRTGAEQVRIGFELPYEPDTAAAEPFDPHLYYVEVRPVRIQSGEAVDPLQNWVGSFTYQEYNPPEPLSGTALWFLHHKPGHFECSVSTETQQLVTRLVGGFVAQARIGKLPSNVLPAIATGIPLFAVPE